MNCKRRSVRPSGKRTLTLKAPGYVFKGAVTAGLVWALAAVSPAVALAEESLDEGLLGTGAVMEMAIEDDGTLTQTNENANIQAGDAFEQDLNVTDEQSGVDDQSTVTGEDTKVEDANAATGTEQAGAELDATLTQDATATTDASAQAADTQGIQDEAAQAELKTLDEVRQGSWVIDDRSGSLERYWVWSDGTVAKNELITPENGAGYYAYATADGPILRGKFDNGAGRIYVADNEGKLMGSDMTSDGWVVTTLYDGHYERYYVDATTKAAVSGFFNVADYGDVFGTGGEGYIIRGDFMFGNRKWSSDNDGKLRSGWYVTSGFGDGIQRYWMGDKVFDSAHAAAENRLVTPTDGAGYYAYATSGGLILRGKFDNGAGRVYIADNDGKLMGSDMSSDDWVVTDLYDGHLERYYVDATSKAAYSGFVRVPGYGDVFGRGGDGFVIRGALPFGETVVLADNDGRLPTQTGWLVTDVYGQGLQRYYIEAIWQDFNGAKPGYSTAGYEHYVTKEGYVLINGVQKIGKNYYMADSDGRLQKINVGWTTVNNKRVFVRTDGSMVEFSDTGYAAWSGIQGYFSGSGYIMAIDNNACRVYVFTGTQGNYMPYAEWIATVGTTPEKGGDDSFGETFRGVSHVRAKGYQMGNCPYEFYWTEFYINSAALQGDGEGQRFHSILYWDQGMTSVYDGTLGQQASHGCVRLATENAKWVYDNIPLGTTVWSY